MKKIETVIKRDNSLIDVVAWHQGYTTGLQEWLGWSYSDSIFYIHDGYTEVMRPPEEHLVEFRDFVLDKINSDKLWFDNKARDFDFLLTEIYDFYDEAIIKIKNGAGNSEVVLIYKDYIDYISRVMAPFITMYWIPAWTENDPVKNEKYKKEIAIALEYRKRSEQVFPKGAELTNLILAKIQEEANISDQLVRVISDSELLSYLLDNKPINVIDLERRWKGFIYSRKGIILTDNSNEDLIKVIAEIGYEFVPKEKEETKEFRGQVACPGKVSGKVRVILTKKDIATILDGEVLVTFMTTPEYLPAMQKSRAFITDEGGITCHAAIVARELKKPCIIGTKIATQVLKDGDMVEVDADNGVVRIINK